ncbi:hypothetical protein AVEN_198128-1 [Araneus ventricosus]|uniref:Uncharacterized protein n=1 Tax=Araneus ventricosus TaxID=182803 RepID=A0A4Y2WL11_ARAVE|nr:hypothetical protein AVEN_198128-1 [Araneus ventricosus]
MIWPQEGKLLLHYENFVNLDSPESTTQPNTHRGGVVALEWNGRVRLELFLCEVTKVVKDIPLCQLKYKGKKTSQTSSLGRPMSSAIRNCTLLYHESFAYSVLWASGLLDLVTTED